MSRRTSRQQESRRRERERRRAQQQRRQERAVEAELAAVGAGLAVPAVAPAAGSEPGVAVLASGRRVAGQLLACGWCGRPILLQRTGRMPKWCSAACRQRAWEHSRAAASGHAAVRVVDRYVAAVPADVPGWINQLSLLAGQITTASGQIPDRNLDQLAAALELAQAAIADRSRWRSTVSW